MGRRRRRARVRVGRPLSISLLVVLLVVLGALSAFTGGFFLVVGLLGDEPVLTDVGNDAVVGMALLSVLVALLFGYSGSLLWDGKESAWRVSVEVAMFALIVSVAVQLVVTTGFVMLGVSWIVTIASIVALVILFLPDNRGYPGRW
ncbi:MAG: hypothetical protein V3V21_00695 [Thermoplasmata archaeon]